MKNRIINGGMVISQRGTSFSITANTVYTLDRFYLRYNGGSASCTVTQSSSAPSGFANSLLMTVGTAQSPVSGNRFSIEQNIEGYNWYDLGYGTANAKTCTLSFWVQSSIAGTYSIALTNFSYSYVATYSIPTANTWTYVTLTIPGPTTGTWTGASNSSAVVVAWDIGEGSDVRTSTTGSWLSGVYLGATGSTNVVATSGATFYITGVQLEVGTQATSFDYRPYGTELALCQRYYQKSFPQGTAPSSGAGDYRVWYGVTGQNIPFPVVMRAAPTMVALPAVDSTAGNWASFNGTWVDFNPNLSGTDWAWNYYGAATATISGRWTASAEL